MNAGNELTVNDAREIAASSGVAWCSLVDYTDPAKNFDGPVTFEPANTGYYIVPVSQPAANLRLAGEDIDVSVCLTDIDFDDFDEDPAETVFIEWDEGHLSLRELIG